MVVCKFFQQGYCRYGQNCRFEHIYGSKYSYHANQPQPQQQHQQLPVSVTDEQLVNQVQNDIQAVFKGNQWILTCYAPFKEKPLFPGIHDLSPEEMRLFIYEAKVNNNLEQAIAYVNNLLKEYRQKYERLLHPDQTIMKTLQCLYKGENVPSPFENTSVSGNAGNRFSNNAASSIFRSAVQGAPITQTSSASIFNQAQQSSNPKDLFATAAKQSVFSQNASVFKSPQAANAKSVFAEANQNVFQQSTPVEQNSFFTSNQNASTPTSIFATANKSIFGQEDRTSPFSQTQGNVVDKPVQSTNVFQKNVDDDSVYSKIEVLMSEELDAFKSNSFRLGFIPEIAPPQELCVSEKGFNYF